MFWNQDRYKDFGIKRKWFFNELGVGETLALIAFWSMLEVGVSMWTLSSDIVERDK